MARAKAAQAMQGHSRGSIHSAILTFKHFFWSTDNLGRKKASCVHERTEGKGGRVWGPEINELLGNRL